MHRPLLALVASAAMTLAACAQSRKVVVDGQEMTLDDAASRAFAAAQAAYDASRFEEAARGFAAVAEQYPDSAYADEARLQRGRALAKLGKLDEAQKVFKDIVEGSRESRFRKQAALELAQIQARQGKKEEAAQSMRTAVEQMSEAEKRESAQKIADAYAGAGALGEAAAFAARALEGATTPEERAARLAEYERALLAMPGPGLARLVADLDRKSPAWPPAALTLARIQLHAGDRTHAEELARQILSEVNTGPVAEGARGIQLAISSSANVKPTLIGIALPLTGDFKGFSDQILNALALAVDLQNRSGVQVSVKDTRGEPDGAAQAVEDLAKDGAIVILGPIGLTEGSAAAVRAQQIGIPIVSLSATEGITQVGDYVFRDMLTKSAGAKAIAQYAQKKLNAHSFGIIAPDSPYGDEVTRAFWDALDEGGSEVRAYEHYPQRTTTFKPFVSRMVGRSQQDLDERKEFMEESQKIIESIQDPYKRRKEIARLKSQSAPVVDFDALFIPDSARTVRLIAPAVASEDVVTSGCDQRELEVFKKTTKREDVRTVQLLGTSLWNNPELVDERMGAGRYVQCAVFADGFFADSQRPATRKFVDDFDGAYHRRPGFLEAHAWDAAMIVRRILDEERPQTREAMRSALASMKKPFDGATGETVFGRDREAQKPLFWLWINRGTIQEFDPEGTPPVPAAVPHPPPLPATSASAPAPQQPGK
jgi:ABC-type branched-subunit amino acid transport system substrate-binding protein/predicted negative regulator of RcsB-dependent stress response